MRKLNIQNTSKSKSKRIMFFRRSFANQLKEANKVFTKTIKSLESISSGINTEVNKNNIKIQKIGDKNQKLLAIQKQTQNQIDKISAFIQ